MKVTVLSYIAGFIEIPTIFEKPFLSARNDVDNVATFLTRSGPGKSSSLRIDHIHSNSR